MTPPWGSTLSTVSVMSSKPVVWNRLKDINLSLFSNTSAGEKKNYIKEWLDVPKPYYCVFDSVIEKWNYSDVWKHSLRD